MTISNNGYDIASLGAFDEYLSLLHKIHESFPALSLERKAVMIAAKSLLFSMSRKDFHEFLLNDELTLEQRERLTLLGIVDTTHPSSQ